MKEFSDSLPNSELEHFWLNMFNYFRKYICVHTFKLNKLNDEENESTTVSSFIHLFTLHVTKKFSFNILKIISLKMEKKLVLKRQAKVKWKPLGRLAKTNSKKMLYRKREISATPIQLHLKELYGESYPHTLAPKPEIN